MYECKICNKEFKLKTDLQRHENRKNKCSKEDIREEGKKVYKCKKCEKIFKLKNNYLVHINRKKSCIEINNEDKIIDKKEEDIIIDIIDEDNIKMNKEEEYIMRKIEEDNKERKINVREIVGDEMMLKMIEELKSKLIEQSNMMIEQKEMIKEQNEKIKEQEEKINKLEGNKTINNNNGNINNGVINNINNNITYVNHGKEDMSKLLDSEIKEIINAGLNSIMKSVMLTHCNDRLPENKNIRYRDTKSGYCEIIEDGRWSKSNFREVVEEMINKHYMEVWNMCKEKRELFESEYKEKLLEEHLEDYSKYIMFELEDQYPYNWNDKMKQEKQREIRKIVNRNREKIKTLIINQTERERILSVVENRERVNKMIINQ